MGRREHCDCPSPLPQVQARSSVIQGCCGVIKDTGPAFLPCSCLFLGSSCQLSTRKQSHPRRSYTGLLLLRCVHGISWSRCSQLSLWWAELTQRIWSTSRGTLTLDLCIVAVWPGAQLAVPVSEKMGKWPSNGHGTPISPEFTWNSSLLSGAAQTYLAFTGPEFL